MKKNFIIACSVIMMTAAGAFFANTGTRDAGLMLQNVEALAQGESNATKKLMSNAAGNRYCCCPGSSTCSSPSCASVHCN